MAFNECESRLHYFEPFHRDYITTQNAYGSNVKDVYDKHETELEAITEQGKRFDRHLQISV
ncbi:hypothetical protein SAMN05660293_01253 [Dyadobacter psychrophilus]|uniref:Uncharacterized protein n=1 Tax=Dyadobacter psychrophilus TaxID=651661 RepID=A0A1T5CH25_9BACT|nr:hypothetical protein SAMN05660293_01253 [Dyadobacter psychrophilus]